MSLDAEHPYKFSLTLFFPFSDDSSVRHACCMVHVFLKFTLLVCRRGHGHHDPGRERARQGPEQQGQRQRQFKQQGQPAPPLHRYDSCRVCLSNNLLLP